MLVLSRKIGESVTVGDSTVITITAIKGGRVTLGIESPFGVIRKELRPEAPKSTKEEKGPSDR